MAYLLQAVVLRHGQLHELLHAASDVIVLLLILEFESGAVVGAPEVAARVVPIVRVTEQLEGVLHRQKFP